MRERILKFIESEGITAAEFADKIGVQRSSVSHVLNGRNNPGFAFIQKILEAFPSIDSRWLLTGSGQMKGQINKASYSEIKNTDLFSTSEDKTSTDLPLKTPQPNTEIGSLKPVKQLKEEIKQPSRPEEKKVIKVLIFYDDHTFEDFRPAK